MDQHTRDITSQKKIVLQAKLEIECCKNICKEYGTKYFLATLFLPKNDRQSTWVVYSFLRIVDEVVDTEDIPPEQAALKVLWLQDRFASFYNQRTTAGEYQYDYVLTMTAAVFKKYSIPYEYSEAFFEAMVSDTSIRSYNTYPELQKYMYGSAGVVGLMMAHIVGYDTKGSAHAILLGEAMQVTNFLRDMGEDLKLRGRIYMPLEDLVRFKINQLDLEKYTETSTIDKSFALYMKSEIIKNRAQYKEANPGIMYLSPRARLGVYLASRLYERTLDKIEQNQYNVFNTRARVSKIEKTITITKSLWNLYLKKSL